MGTAGQPPEEGYSHHPGKDPIYDGQPSTHVRASIGYELESFYNRARRRAGHRHQTVF
jgi:hypothetical protein